MKLLNNCIFFAASSLSNIYIISKSEERSSFIDIGPILHNVYKDFNNSSNHNNWIIDPHTITNAQFILNTFDKDVLPDFDMHYIIDSSIHINSNNDFSIIYQIYYLCGMH